MALFNSVAVMARAPIPGKVKQRLAAAIGNAAATAVYEATLRDSVALASSFVGSRNTFVFFASSNSEAHVEYSCLFPAGVKLLPQCEGDIGTRMLHALSAVLEKRPSRVLLIGSDAPDIPCEYLQLALDSLDAHDLALGPADDGGFYLIGASRKPPDAVFDDVHWSSQRTLAGVLANSDKLKLRCKLLPPWQDVDEIDDLQALNSRLKNGTSHAPCTRRVLELHNFLEQ